MSHHESDHDLLRELRESMHRIEQILLDLVCIVKGSANRTKSIAIQFSGDSTMNSLTLNVGQTSQASIVPFLADGVTNSGGTVSNVAYSFSDPSATVVLNPDGLTATVTGVAASSGPISGSATCTVTDTDGVVSQWTQPFTVTVAAVVPPAQLTQSVGVEFSTPA